jgi:hypothetical protein
MNARKVSSRTAASGSSEVEAKAISLNERLGLIALIDERMRLGSPEPPIVPDLFNNLWEPGAPQYAVPEKTDSLLLPRLC